MDLNLTPNEQQFRDEFRAWLAVNTPPEWTGDTNAEDRADYLKYLRDWQRKLYEGGWAGISPRSARRRSATATISSSTAKRFGRALRSWRIGVCCSCARIPRRLSTRVLLASCWTCAVTVFQCAPCGRCPGTQVLTKCSSRMCACPSRKCSARSTRVGPRPSRR